MDFEGVHNKRRSVLADIVSGMIMGVSLMAALYILDFVGASPAASPVRIIKGDTTYVHADSTAIFTRDVLMDGTRWTKTMREGALHVSDHGNGYVWYDIRVFKTDDPDDGTEVMHVMTVKNRTRDAYPSILFD